MEGGVRGGREGRRKCIRIEKVYEDVCISRANRRWGKGVYGLSYVTTFPNISR